LDFGLSVVCPSKLGKLKQEELRDKIEDRETRTRNPCCTSENKNGVF